MRLALLALWLAWAPAGASQTPVCTRGGDCARWALSVPPAAVPTDALVIGLPDGSVLLLGGHRNGEPARDVWSYAADRGWKQQPGLNQARVQAAASLVDDGRAVLITGGKGGTGPLRSTERLDLNTGAWTAAAELHQARWGHTATSLPGGRVLVVGGSRPDAPTESVEIFESGGWTERGRLRARSNHTAAPLAGGPGVVVVGHRGGSRGLDLFDDGMGTWMAGPPLAAARQRPAVFSVPEGVLVVGGRAGGVGPVAELVRAAPLPGMPTPAPVAVRAGQASCPRPIGASMGGRSVVLGCLDGANRAAMLVSERPSVGFEVLASELSRVDAMVGLPAGGLFVLGVDASGQRQAGVLQLGPAAREAG